MSQCVLAKASAGIEPAQVSILAWYVPNFWKKKNDMDYPL